jgi:tRNA(Ile2) C34 agmatinyltransferase TiaS
MDDGSTDRVLLSETNIPVGGLGVGPTIVEALTSNLMTYTTVMIAAVGVVAVAVIALVMFRKRTPVICEKCGRKMGRESMFCDKCGTALASTDRS